MAKGGFTKKKSTKPARTGGHYVASGKNGDFRRWVPDKKKKAKAPSPDQQLANITNEEFDIYKADFLPVEEELIAEVTDEQRGNKAAEKAMRDFQEGFGRQKKVRDRGLGRQGIETTAGQQAKMGRAEGLATAVGSVGAANMARRATIAEDEQTVSEMVNAGQSLRGIALQGLGAAAGMQTQRDMQGRAAASQQSQNFMGNVATGAGVGMATFGPPGALVGAGVGALVSLF